MDCLENENVCSVKKEDNLDFYRIHTIWMKDGFRINIASKNGAWSGEMTQDKIKEFSHNLQIDQDKYLTECKEALTADDGKKGYSYAVENGCFNWKKMIDEDSGMKVKMGSVMLQPVSFTETLQNIIEVSLKYKKNLKQQVDNLLKNNEANCQRINDLQIKLEELIEKKNIMEEDLYNKFLLLLNTKKRKIQELEEYIYSKKNKTKFGKEEKESQNSESHTNTHKLHPYEMETEEDEYYKAPEIKKLAVKSKIKKTQKKKVTSCKYETGRITPEINLNMESDNFTSSSINDNKGIDKPDIIPDKEPEDIPKPASSSTQNSNKVKKSIPATKNDILDFFFG